MRVREREGRAGLRRNISSSWGEGRGFTVEEEEKEEEEEEEEEESLFKADAVRRRRRVLLTAYDKSEGR